MIGQRMRRTRDGFTGIVIDHSAWSNYYFLVEDARGERALATDRELSHYWTAVPLEALLAADAVGFSARMAAIPHVLRWLCEQLVRALLWGAWLQMLKREGEALDRAFLRFCRLVDATPCWPCRVEYGHPGRRTSFGFAGLSITSGRAADDADRMAEYMDENFR